MQRGAIRSFIVVLSLAAWFALSNHCAIGAAAGPEGSASEPTGCPMHSPPAKQKPATKTPCCKDLRAIVAKCVAANPVALRLLSPRDYTTAIFAPPLRIAVEIEELDTGPPGCLSFAESVLQESMLSHAPPVS
jgi:hypothetical protein